jgi:MFS transporter, MHS family, proline/betaine transporter
MIIERYTPANCTGVVAYLLEGAARHRRGLIASSAAAASEVGGLLAAGVCAVTVASMSSAELDAWGWRVPFLVGAVLAAAVWIARSAMQESPEFAHQRSKGTVPLAPLYLALMRQRMAVVQGFAISALGSVTYYVGITYVPAFLVAVHAMSEAGAVWIATIAACAVVLVTPIAGALSDSVGRKPVLLLLCGSAAVLPMSMFALMSGGSIAQAIAGAVALAFLGGGVSAIGAVTSAELLPGEGRLSGLALGATMATAVFGGLTPFLSQLLIEKTGWHTIPGAMIAVVAICVMPVFIAIPETRPRM